jgi:predicted Zn-ribbon and HTH transcriptional regulator
MSEEKILVCPECKSGKVCTEYHQMVDANTYDHYCHSVKAHDDYSPATCLECGWKGKRKNLVSAPEGE